MLSFTVSPKQRSELLKNRPPYIYSSFMSDRAERVIEIARKRGIFWPSYEIYGGVAGLYDLGPVGIRIKNNIVALWRKLFVEENQDFVVEIETPVITPLAVLQASGHVDNFTDPVVQCLKCRRVYRADHLVEQVTRLNTERMRVNELEEIISKRGLKCPNCGGELGDVRTFNLLFETNIGPYGDSKGFFRPETAQGIFTAFKRVFESFRERLPLGVAQVGRVARNEISPRQGLIRLREFTIMEVEFFFDPSSDEGPPMERLGDLKVRILRGEDKLRGGSPMELKLKEAVDERIVNNPWMGYWMGVASKFVEALGIRGQYTYFEEKLPEERAHYSSQTFDQIVVVDDERIEISGHAYRGDYDLSRHIQFSGQDLTVFRKFDRPREVEKEVLVVDKVKLFSGDRERAKEFLERIQGMSQAEISRLLDSDELISGLKVRDFITKEKRRERVTGERIVPHVAEPSFGAERCLYVSLLSSLKEREGRNILSLPYEVSPYKVAVFPLLEREEIVAKSLRIYEKVRLFYPTIFDSKGSIGKRYARADEIGVPFAVTIDVRTLSDDTVTIRSRDTWEQVRVREESILGSLDRLFKGESLEAVGEKVME